MASDPNADAMSVFSVDGRLETVNGVSVLTHTPLDTARIIASVGDDGAGATAVFIGTTRDSFKGKVVTRLDYQSYTKLALKTMDTILAATRKSVSGMLHAAVYHRLGTVPVGEPSIVIAVSSPHRKEAFVACEMILEDVKARAQIWKREFYEDEPDEAAQWKENHS